VDIIKMNLREMDWSRMKSIYLAQVRDQWLALLNTVMNFQVSENSGMFLSSCPTGWLLEKSSAP
jgi:hypothetical protein